VRTKSCLPACLPACPHGQANPPVHPDENQPVHPDENQPVHQTRPFFIMKAFMHDDENRTQIMAGIARAGLLPA
jgi:hypothetical protein